MANCDIPLLEISSLVCGYGNKQVLRGVSIDVFRGEIVAMIGHNGAGKSTLLKAVFGVMRPWEGHILLDGELVSAPTPRRMLLEGVVYVPQGENVFLDLTVGENLKMAGAPLANRAQLALQIERVLDVFPLMRLWLDRKAAFLSGGERQMVALARAYATSPRLLLLDEPSLGLAPPAVGTALQQIQLFSQQFGCAALIVEQKVRQVLKIAQRVVVLRDGAVSFSGSTQMINSDEKLQSVYL